MRTRCLLFLLSGLSLWAGPREFGRSELRKAIQTRGLRDLRFEEAIGSGAPESYTIAGNKITGADERGLMYGLLAAAEQILRGREGDAIERRATHAHPRHPLFLHNADLERDWYYSHEYWDEYLSMLARNRFNRFNLVFAHQTDYLAPPYPFWVDLPEFPDIRARNLTAAQRNAESGDAPLHLAGRRRPRHRFHSGRLGAQYPDDQESADAADDGRASRARTSGRTAMRRSRRCCSSARPIRSVQMRTNTESGIPNDQQVEFYANYVFRAIRDCGREVHARSARAGLSPAA